MTAKITITTSAPMRGPAQQSAAGRSRRGGSSGRDAHISASPSGRQPARPQHQHRGQHDEGGRGGIGRRDQAAEQRGEHAEPDAGDIAAGDRADAAQHHDDEGHDHLVEAHAARGSGVRGATSAAASATAAHSKAKTREIDPRDIDAEELRQLRVLRHRARGATEPAAVHTSHSSAEHQHGGGDDQHVLRGEPDLAGGSRIRIGLMALQHLRRAAEGQRRARRWQTWPKPSVTIIRLVTGSAASPAAASRPARSDAQQRPERRPRSGTASG